MCVDSEKGEVREMDIKRQRERDKGKEEREMWLVKKGERREGR